VPENEMTPAEYNQKIAEWLGWTDACWSITDQLIIGTPPPNAKINGLTYFHPGRAITPDFYHSMDAWIRYKAIEQFQKDYEVNIYIDFQLKEVAIELPSRERLLFPFNSITDLPAALCWAWEKMEGEG